MTLAEEAFTIGVTKSRNTSKTAPNVENVIFGISKIRLQVIQHRERQLTFLPGRYFFKNTDVYFQKNYV